MRTLWISLLALGLGASQAVALDQVAPRLGAASNFGQSWFPQILDGSTKLPMRLYRDEMFWSGVERDGEFKFDNPRITYPDSIAELGQDVMFIVNNGHPDYDDDWTPSSPEAVAAFANYARRIVLRFPTITVLEIGNEMNSETFATGPGWSEDLSTRAASYAKLLKSTSTAVREVRPDIRILGGAAHSIPIAWFKEIFTHDIADHMDALEIHPYTVAPEHLVRQIALLRHEVPQVRDMPIAVTEFGEDDQSLAPEYLIKAYCQLALAGVESAVWYPLNPRGDGLTPLLTQEGRVTDVGRAYRTALGLFEGRKVTEYRPDPFTYGCKFGERTLVVWGEDRAVEVDPEVSVLSAEGSFVPARNLRLSPDAPLVLTVPGGEVWPGVNVRLGPQTVVADSWHQFQYPGHGADPFERFLRVGKDLTALQMRPGQERDGVPWTPYLATEIDGLARASASWALPLHGRDGPIEVLYRYQANQARTVDVTVQVKPEDSTEDGVIIRVELNGAAIAERLVVSGEHFTVPNVGLKPADVLDFVLNPRETATGDASEFRVTLKDPDA